MELVIVFLLGMVIISLLKRYLPQSFPRKKNKMKVLVIGSGYWELVMVRKMSQNLEVSIEAFCAPGNDEISRMAQCIDISVDKVIELADFAQEEEFNLILVGPELSSPLQIEIVDEFSQRGLAITIPTREELERKLH
jgi:phosphoribosylamine--glycine ligase